MASPGLTLVCMALAAGLACGGATPEAPATSTSAGSPAKIVQGPTEGCLGGTKPITSLDGYEGPKPPLDEDGMLCGVRDGKLYVTHIEMDIGSVVDRYSRHFATHDFEVDGFGDDLPVEMPAVFMRSMTQGDKSYRMVFASRPGNFVDVQMSVM